MKESRAWDEMERSLRLVYDFEGCIYGAGHRRWLTRSQRLGAQGSISTRYRRMQGDNPLGEVLQLGDSHLIS